MGKAAKYKLEQVAIRMVKEPPIYSDIPILTAQDAVGVIAKALSDYDREVFGVINVKADGRPANMNIASMGTLRGSIANTREVLKSTILSNTDRVLFFHNHPSGNLRPSEQDIQTTDKLLTACALMDIGVMDHIILGGGNEREYYSFLENEILMVPEIFYKTKVEELDFEQRNYARLAVKYEEHFYRRKEDKEKQKTEGKMVKKTVEWEKEEGEGRKGEEQSQQKKGGRRVSVRRKLEENKGKVGEEERGKRMERKGKEMGME